MSQKFEYKFVRMGEGWMQVRESGTEHYQSEIDKYARDGWRLVQIFAPGTGAYGAAKFYELVLERETG